MSARIAHIRNPIAPAMDMRVWDVDAGVNVTAAIGAAGWRLPPSTFLIKRDALDSDIDWRTARACDVFVKRDAWDIEPLADGETAILVTLPQGQQGGSQGIAQAVAMIALVIVAAYIAGPAGAGAAISTELGVSAATGAAIAFSTVLIAGQFLLSVILPPIKPNTSLPAPTYNIGPQSNQARLGQAIPERFGRNCIFPDLRSQPYTEFADNTDTVYELFCIGVGYYYVEQIRIGTNVIAQADESGVLQPTGNYPEIAWQLVGPNGTFNFFHDNVVTSSEVSGIELIGTNQLNYAWTAWFVTNPPNTATTLIALDLSCPGGVYSVGDSGGIGKARVTFAFEAQLIDDVGVILGDPFYIVADGIVEGGNNQPYRFTWECNVPCGRYQVRGHRTNGVNQQTGPGNPLVWNQLRCYLPSQQNYGNCTMLGIKATATYNLSQESADSINVVCTRILPTPVETDGVWAWDYDSQPTRSIGAAAYYLLGSSNCAGLDDSVFHRDWFLTYEPLWQSRGDTFDGGFTSQLSFWDMLNQVLNCGRAQALPGPYIDFSRDEAKSVYRCAFSPRSMLPDTFAINYLFFDPNNADAVTLTYMDERNWVETQLFIALPDSTDTVDTAPKTAVNGMVSRDQVWREWNYKLAASAYRRIFPSFQTELDGRVCYRGDLVRLSHVMVGWGASADVLAITLDEGDDSGDSDILTLSEPWTLAGGVPTLEITTPDGYIAGPVDVLVIDDGLADESGVATHMAEVQLLGPCVATQGNYAGAAPRDWGIWGLNSTDGRRDLQRERPKALMGMGTETPIDALIVSMQPQASLKCQVACVVDDPRVYVADQLPVPPYIVGSCDGGNANLQVTALEIDQSIGSYPDGMDVVLDITVVGATDADSFDYQFSLNSGAWQGPVFGNLRNFTLRTFAGEMQLQIRAEGAGADGAWFELDFNADGTGVVGLGLDFSIPFNSQYLYLFRNQRI